MKIRPYILIFFCLLLFGSTQTKPKILVIGDSISIGYTPYVKELLLHQAEVFHNPGNAGHTGMGLAKIEEWLGDGDWDIIQFNWGLWDLCYRQPDSKVQGNRDKVNGTLTATVDEYASRLDSIVTVLQGTDARLVFLTTTYVPKEEAGRFSKDAIRYNKAAKKVMKKRGVLVHDIYGASRLIHQEHGKGADDVHYTEEGYDQLGQVVAKFLESEVAVIGK